MRSEPGVLHAAALGALTGVRSMGPPALVAREITRRPRNIFQRRTPKGRWLARGLQIMALGELFADKGSDMPDRTEPPILFARAVAGGILGAYTFRRNRVLGALIGAGSSVAATYASFSLRSLATRRGRAAGVAAGLVEDALMMMAAKKLAAGLP